MKKAIALLAAVVVAACTCVGIVHDDADIPQEIPAIIETISVEPENDTSDEEPDKNRKIRRTASGTKTALQLLISLPLSFLGNILKWILSSLAGTVFPAVGFILTGILGTFAALLAVLCILYKSLFPDKSLKNLLTKRNLLRILIASAIIPALCRIVELSFPNAKAFEIVLRIISLMLAVLWLWHSTFALKGKFPMRLYNVFRSRGGLCLTGIIIALSFAEIFAEIYILCGNDVAVDICKSLSTYIVCAATAFAMYLRVKAQRTQDKRKQISAACDGFYMELPTKTGEVLK